MATDQATDTATVEACPRCGGPRIGPDGRRCGCTVPVPEAPSPFPVIPGYDIEAQIGKGGMGVVFRAVRTDLGRTVALKVLPSPLDPNPSRIDRFRREAKALAAVEHPNIVQIHHADLTGPVPYIEMALVDGVPLSQEIEKGPLPLTRALEIGIDVARGIAHLEQKGLVHRDLKPSNIMLTRDGSARILDMGLVRLLCPDPKGRNLSFSGMVAGTFDWMAPEQAQDSSTVTSAADVYSLGLVLCDCLVRRGPLDGPARRPPDQDAGLLSLILRMVERRPEARPGPAQVLEQLEAIRSSMRIRARELTARQRLSVVLVALAITPLLMLAGGPLSRASWDLSVCLFGRGGLHPDVMLVDTGPPGSSLETLARAIAGLARAGAGAVALDILFDRAAGAPGTAGHARVEALRRAIEQAGNVVLVCDRGDGKSRGREPLPPLAAAAAGIGFGNLPEDADGVTRRAVLAPSGPGHPHEALALAAVRALRRRTGGSDPRPPDRVPVDFHSDGLSLQPSGEIDLALASRIVPLAVAAGSAQSEALAPLKGKLVFVGCLDRDVALAGDRFQTPFRLIGKPAVTGLWIHAAVASALLSGSGPRTPGLPVSLAAVLAGALLPLVLIVRCRSWLRFGLGVSWCGVAALVLAQFALPALDVFFDPVGFLAAECASVAAVVLAVLRAGPGGRTPGPLAGGDGPPPPRTVQLAP